MIRLSSMFIYGIFNLFYINYIITLPKLYTTYLKMYTIKYRFYAIQTILPTYLHQKAIRRICQGMVWQFGIKIK